MYLFLDLLHEKLPVFANKSLIFAQTETYLAGDFEVFKSPIELVQSHLNATDTYYVMHESIMVKGKIKRSLGVIVLANRLNLLDYLGRNLNDLRPLRIMALNDPRFLIVISDEGTGLLYVQDDFAC